jgi:hypothetical protein
MAANNLVSKSLGSILQQTGNGVPTHVAPMGTMYVDINTGRLYVYSNAFGWIDYNKTAFAAAYINDNVTTSPFASTGWFTTTNLTWTPIGGNGISATTDGRLILSSNLAGRYKIITEATIQYVATTAIYQFGTATNLTIYPGSYSDHAVGTTTSGSFANIGSNHIITLSANSVVQGAIYGAAGATVIIKNASISIKKIV